MGLGECHNEHSVPTKYFHQDCQEALGQEGRILNCIIVVPAGGRDRQEMGEWMDYNRSTRKHHQHQDNNNITYQNVVCGWQ